MLRYIYGIFKSGTDAPNGRAGIKTQMYRMDLRAWGGVGEGKLG